MAEAYAENFDFDNAINNMIGSNEDSVDNDAE